MFREIVQDIEKKGWSHQQHIVDQKTLATVAAHFDESFRPAQVGKGSSKDRIEEIRGDSIRWIDVLNPERELHYFVDLIEKLKQELNREFFLGIKDFECHLAKYPQGSFYKKHLDRFSNDSSRVFSFIFYLHETWEKSDGGELVLYDKKGEMMEKIIPVSGSMVCFMSEEIPHEVLPAKKERRSLTGWMHTKIIN